MPTAASRSINTNMVDSAVSRYTKFPYIIQNPTVNSVRCCLKCSDLEGQLEEWVCGKTKHPLSIRRQRNAAHEHQLNLLEAHSTSTWELETNMIPITVNGQINASKEDSKTSDAIDKLDHVHKLVKESTVEVTKQD